MQLQSKEDESLLSLYMASFKSKFTAQHYLFHLNKYANHDISSLLRLSQRDAEDRLISFIIEHKDNDLAWGALHNYTAAIAKFYLINDITLNMQRVNRFMPEQTTIKKDRAYTSEEIYNILQMANEGTRAIILLLASSGMRLGGLIGLKLCDLEDKGDFYKITVYRNTKQEYYTFCTPEARKALDVYFGVRGRHGEHLDHLDPNRGGPVIREQYNQDDRYRIREPHSVTPGNIAKVVEDVLLKSGLRQRLPRIEKANAIYKKDISITKGFRKFFNTQLVSAGVNPLIKEMLMGHKVGLEENYYRPQEDDVQAEYEKAVDALTINPENRLKREVKSLTEKQDEITLMRLKHEKEMEEMRNDMNKITEDAYTTIADEIIKLRQEVHQLKKEKYLK